MDDDQKIAALCEVARSAGTDLSATNKALLPDLIASGHVAPADTPDNAHPRYKLTPAGQAVLDERGVGANES